MENINNTLTDGSIPIPLVVAEIHVFSHMNTFVLDDEISNRLCQLMKIMNHDEVVKYRYYINGAFDRLVWKGGSLVNLYAFASKLYQCKYIDTSIFSFKDYCSAMWQLFKVGRPEPFYKKMCLYRRRELSLFLRGYVDYFLKGVF